MLLGVNYPTRKPYGIAVVVLCLTSLVASTGNAHFSKETIRPGLRQTVPSTSLRLTLNAIDMKYCPGDAELDSLVMTLRLSYINVGSKPLILYRGSNSVSRIIIGRSADAKGNFEVNSTLTVLTDGDLPRFKTSSLKKAFVVLHPGDTFQKETTIDVFVVKGDTREIQGAVKSGKHFIQIEVLTWPSSRREASRLKQLWRRIGLLWHFPIASEPMPFEIDKEHKLSSCP